MTKRITNEIAEARDAEYAARLEAAKGSKAAEYWAGSAFTSVMADYAAGRVTVIKAGKRKTRAKRA